MSDFEEHNMGAYIEALREQVRNVQAARNDYRRRAETAEAEIAVLEVDRDEWKRQHENLVEVRRADLEALNAKLVDAERARDDAWSEYDKMADTARSFGKDLADQQAVSRALSGTLDRVGRVDRISALEAERDGYRMALDIVWEAITPTMMEEQCANFIAGYVRTALDNPTAAVLRETHAELVKGKALDDDDGQADACQHPRPNIIYGDPCPYCGRANV